MKRSRFRLPLFALALFASAADAQLDTTQRYTITPYFWMAGLNGQVGVGPVATDIDLSFSDVMDKFQFGVMLYGEARFHPWVVNLDFLYIALGDNRAIAFRGDTGSFTLNQKETMVQPMGGYTYTNGPWAVDGVIGMRIWSLNAALDVDRPRASNRRSATRNWVDALGGIKAHFTPSTMWGLFAGGDAGGGGSKGTWQAYGGASGRFSSWFSASLSYRALGVNYDHDRFLYDVTTKGFTIAATFRF